MSSNLKPYSTPEILRIHHFCIWSRRSYWQFITLCLQLHYMTSDLNSEYFSLNSKLHKDTLEKLLKVNILLWLGDTLLKKLQGCSKQISSCMVLSSCHMELSSYLPLLKNHGLKCQGDRAGKWDADSSGEGRFLSLRLVSSVSVPPLSRWCFVRSIAWGHVELEGINRQVL